MNESAKQQERYNLLKEPSVQDSQRIKEIERERALCTQCTGLDECLYSGDGRGFKPCIIATNLGRFPKNLLYFGVEKCEWLKETERASKERRREEESGLPNKSFELNEAQMRTVEHLINGDYWISGNHCSGKTQILRELGMRLMQSGRRVRYTTQSELLIDLKVTNPQYHEKMKEYREVEVLLIDDWKGALSGYNEEQIWVILNKRGMRNRKTVISSREWIRNQRERLRERLEHYEEIRI